MTPQAFAKLFGPLCQAAMRKHGGFASVRLAQIALESGWAKYTPKDIDTGKESYNLTGVKGVGPAGSVLAWTEEWDGTRMVKVKDFFRAYNSYEEHILERDSIFEWDNYDAYRAAKTPDDACRALQNAPMPYATDPEYADKLIGTMNANGFKEWDVLQPFPDMPADAWYAEAAAGLKALGALQGDEKGNLNPSAPLTRAEAVALLWRVLKALKLV